MSDLFLKIINMSISASWLVLVVLLLRFVLKKAPKWASVLLWGIVAVRLVLPFSIESVLSLIPTAQTISPDIMMDSMPSVQTGIPAINSVINPVIGSSFAPDPGASVNPLQIWIPVLSVIWVVGVAALILYTAVSYWRLRRKVSEAVILRDNIYQSENVGSPFVLGMIKPKIYLSYNMGEQDLSHVVAHEQAHIRRKDHWWKPIGFLLLSIHWFNPLMWLAYVLLCRDIELACDEKVIKEMGNEQRADYTQALVACSVNRRMIAACPLAFGEVGVKERVKSVMNYKKPAFWIIILTIIACVVVAVCFLTNPVGEEHPDDGYYLLIGADGVESVEISLPNSGGGIVNADGSPFKQGEKLWLEHLQGVTDLRGLKIVAFGADGEVMYALSVPENATDAEIINSVGGDGWLIAPTEFEEPFGSFESAIANMNNKDNVQVFDTYAVDTDVVLAGFTTGNDLSFATFVKNNQGVYKIRGYREFGKASLYSMTIMQEQDLDQSITVALSSRSDLAKVTAEYGGTVLEKTVSGCPAMIVFEWPQILPEGATVDVRFYDADGRELERIDGPVDDNLLAQPTTTDDLDTRIDIRDGCVDEFIATGQGTQWNDGIAFDALAPNEEILSASGIVLEEPNSTVECTIGYARTGLTLTYGLIDNDGKEYSLDVVGGHGRGSFENLPEGSYRLFVRNSDYSGVPAYENPEDFPDVSFDATGVINYKVK